MMQVVRYLMEVGNGARDRKAWRIASYAYAAYLRMKPADPAIWVQYGHALKESGRPKAALEAYRRSDRIHPEQYDTHLQIGQVLELMGGREAVDHYDHAALLAPENASMRRRAFAMRQAQRPDLAGLPKSLRYVNIGTTNVCNASCVHCPTGKATTAHIPRHPMDMALYRRIMTGVYELGLPIHQLGFGLFGDALADPLVVQRTDFARRLYPQTELVINTNGAAFNPAKHDSLRDFGVIISLHCESLMPEVFDHLMQPLRAVRVFPKYQAILSAFPGKVNISIPVSRLNLGELAAMRSWFTERGARSVTFDPLSSRCAEDRTLFDDLALRPSRIHCPSMILDDLIVDADGQVLLCCQDFQRVESMGDLSSQTVAECLISLRRARVRQILDARRHDELASCSRCYGDLRNGEVFRAAVPA